MDIRHLTGTSWQAVAPPLVAAPRSPAGATPPVGPSLGAAKDSYEANRSGQTLKQAPVPPDAVKVAVHRRDDGVTLITLYDSRSGQMIAQMPPEAVINAIDDALNKDRHQDGDGPSTQQNTSADTTAGTTNSTTQGKES